MRKFYSKAEGMVVLYPMLHWLHERVDPNCKQSCFDYEVHSDGSSYTSWRSKNNKWALQRYDDHVVVEVDDEYEMQWLLVWAHPINELQWDLTT